MAEPPEPDAEMGVLRAKVAALEAELKACRSLLEREQKLRLRAQASAAKLRREVGGSRRGRGGTATHTHTLPLLRESCTAAAVEWQLFRLCPGNAAHLGSCMLRRCPKQGLPLKLLAGCRRLRRSLCSAV